MFFSRNVYSCLRKNIISKVIHGMQAFFYQLKNMSGCTHSYYHWRGDLPPFLVRSTENKFLPKIHPRKEESPRAPKLTTGGWVVCRPPPRSPRQTLVEVLLTFNPPPEECLPMLQVWGNSIQTKASGGAHLWAKMGNWSHPPIFRTPLCVVCSWD